MSAISSDNKLAGLQALRGIAALLVFLHHSGWPPSELLGFQRYFAHTNAGLTGVLLFFGLSGYVMTYRQRNDPIVFFRDRCLRIFPGLWAALMLPVIFNWMSGLGPPFDPRILILYPSSTAMPSWIPYWTLVYEMSFYVLVFFAMLAPARFRLAIIMSCLALSYALPGRPIHWNNMSPGFTGLICSWYSLFFLVGVVVARLPVLTNKTVAYGTLAFGAALMALSPFNASAPLSWPDGVPSILYAVGVGLILAFFVSWPAKSLLGRILVVVGDASYGIYLTHIIFLYFFSWLCKLWIPSAAPILICCLVWPAALASAFAFGVMESRVYSGLKSLASRRFGNRHSRRDDRGVVPV